MNSGEASIEAYCEPEKNICYVNVHGNKNYCIAKRLCQNDKIYGPSCGYSTFLDLSVDAFYVVNRKIVNEQCLAALVSLIASMANELCTLGLVGLA
jgi:hypothetical protein